MGGIWRWGAVLWAFVVTGCQLVIGIEDAKLAATPECVGAECEEVPETFRLGGTVNGLEGTGLVLETGSQSVTINGPAATFVFPERFETGDAYAVRIRTQPASPAQGCRIVAGTGVGTVGTSDALGVVVNCGTDFSVGGTVSGLAGDGLALTSNGHTVVVSGQAFAFPPLPSGTAYDVSVMAQPTDPSQTCTVTSGTGTLEAEDVATVQVSCTTNQYAISGTLEGLTAGESVELTLNGGTPQLLTANGPFDLAGDVESGTSFMVTVNRQPLGVKACSFIDGSGIGPVADADVDTVVVTCIPSPVVTGGTFKRSYDQATDNMFPDPTNSATVGDFRLDKYEVTVGRFRKFVEAGKGTQAEPPVTGSGAHPRIAGTGWDPAWNASLPLNTATLVAGISGGTWTDLPGANENKPINAVTWFDAQAFCAWEGGYLPSEAELNYAASGGSEQRAFPWSPSSQPSLLTINSTYVVYDGAAIADVGSKSPTGDGKWGHADLGGNVNEWVLDWHGALPNPCVNCARLTEVAPYEGYRTIRGGSFVYNANFQRSAFRYPVGPATRNTNHGIRCGRFL